MKRTPARHTSTGGTLTEPSVFGRPPATRRHPPGRPRQPVSLTEIRALLAEGHSLRVAARRLRVGYGTLYRAVQGAGSPSVVIQNSRRGIL